MVISPDPGPSPADRPEPPGLLIIWLIVGLVLLAATLMLWLAMWPGSDPVGALKVAISAVLLIGPLPIVLGMLTIAALAGSIQAHRRRSASLVLGHLSSAIQLNLPLPAYLRSAAGGESRSTYRRLSRMASDLEAGDSVSGALADAASELPRLTLDRIMAAERSFALGGALGEILERERRRTVDVSPGMPNRAYASIVIAMTVLITWLMMIFVMPKFAQIFSDFRMKLPWVTQALVDYFPIFLSTLVIVAGLLTALTLLARATRMLFVRRPYTPTLFGWVLQPIQWYLPVWGRLTRNRQMAVVCETLAEALIAGRPLPEAIGIATLPSLNLVLRHKLVAWRALVEQGQPIATAARQARVPRLLCDLLAGTTADDGHGAAGAVVFAGRAYAGASGRLAAVLSAVAPVVVTGVLAVFVAFVALAMFMPMITLLNGMTGGEGRR